jgi:hypothetical protein
LKFYRFVKKVPKMLLYINIMLSLKG